jgi:hypothetical protein
MQTAQIENRIVGKHLVSKKPRSNGFDYVAYKRVSNAGFYNTVRAYKGYIYGMVGSEKTVKPTMQSPIEMVNNYNQQEIRYKKAYSVIYKAFPEAKEGIHKNGLITIIL